MKRLIYLFTLVLSFFVMSKSINAQVTVTATAGNLGPAFYTTVKSAFDSINSGFHQGAITILITASTTETASASLNASGVGSSSYTSVLMRPSAAAVIVQGTFSGAVIKLTGADNVTIDGRIGGVGIIRDLTIRNNSNATATAAIWLASGSTAGDTSGARRNRITWCEISCNARQDSTSALTSFGIISQGISITSPTSSDGTNNDSNSFIQNRIIRCR